MSGSSRHLESATTLFAGTTLLSLYSATAAPLLLYVLLLLLSVVVPVLLLLLCTVNVFVLLFVIVVQIWLQEKKCTVCAKKLYSSLHVDGYPQAPRVLPLV